MFQIPNYPDIELIRERLSVFDIELPKLLLTDAERPSSISLQNCEKLKNIPLKLAIKVVGCGSGHDVGRMLTSQIW